VVARTHRGNPAFKEGCRQEKLAIRNKRDKGAKGRTNLDTRLSEELDPCVRRLKDVVLELGVRGSRPQNRMNDAVDDDAADAFREDGRQVRSDDGCSRRAKVSQQECRGQSRTNVQGAVFDLLQILTSVACNKWKRKRTRREATDQHCSLQDRSLVGATDSLNPQKLTPFSTSFFVQTARLRTSRSRTTLSVPRYLPIFAPFFCWHA
jgi:hypothetical protein